MGNFLSSGLSFYRVNAQLKSCVKFKSRFALFAFVILTVTTLYAGTYSGGTGDPNDPYQISRVADWQELMSTYQDWGAYFELTTDLDFEGIELIPVGRNYPYFEGVFEGNHHTISNARIGTSSSYYVGLFGYTRSAYIYNLNLTNCHIIGESYVGTLVGKNEYSSIVNCSATGAVSARYVAGGLVGSNGGIINNSNSTCDVITELGTAGGLAGSSDGHITYVDNCYSTGTVSGSGGVGGLIGSSQSPITNSYSTATVIGTTNAIGGLLGVNSGNISNCYSLGQVNGAEDTGGLVGKNYSIISNCYSTGQVNGTGDFVGGLLGNAIRGTVNSCFWDKETSGIDISAGDDGVIGLTTEQMKTYEVFANAGWDFISETINGFCDNWTFLQGQYPQLTFLSGVGLQGIGTDADPYQIYSISDLLAVNRDVLANYRLMADLDLSITEWHNAIVNVFYGGFDGNKNVLKNFTVDQPDISNIAIFGNVGVGGNIRNLNITDVNIIGNDYIAGLAGYTLGATLENCRVSGTLRCMGYTAGGLVAGAYKSSVISNCQSTVTIHSVGHTVGGLIGDNDRSTVMNCHSFSTVSGDWANLGGLIGHNYYSTVINCSSTATVFMTDPYVDYVGGLIGYSSLGSISGCWSNSQTTGRYYVGGLIGGSSSPIEKSYSTGQVIGDHEVGGLVGTNAGVVTECYSNCSVNGSGRTGGLLGVTSKDTISSFWNIESSGTIIAYILRTSWIYPIVENPVYSMSGVAEGKTTGEMMTQSTFAGWDFETPVWWMCVDGIDYPRLSWEIVFPGTPDSGLRLDVDSDCNDVGDDSYCDSKDVIGMCRAGTVDIGAYEYVEDVVISIAFCDESGDAYYEIDTNYTTNLNQYLGNIDTYQNCVIKSGLLVPTYAYPINRVVPSVSDLFDDSPISIHLFPRDSTKGEDVDESDFWIPQLDDFKYHLWRISEGMKADYVILSIDNSGSMYTANLGVEGDGTGGYEQFTDWVVDTEDGLGAALVENEYFGLEYWIDWINTGIEDLLE